MQNRGIGQILYSRKETKERRERHAVELCCEWHSRRTNTEFKVLPRPSRNLPPDGLIGTSNRIRWVEVVGVTLGAGWDRYSEEIGDGIERDLPEHILINPDQTFAATFSDRVEKKLFNNTYADVYSRYGHGLLVTILFYPLFDKNTLRLIKEELLIRQVSFDNSFFSDGVILVNPYHAGARQIGLRAVLAK